MSREFHVRVPASTLTDANLSRGAHHLHAVLLAKADGRTGELKIRGNWLRRDQLAKAANIPVRTFNLYLTELVRYAYVYRHRPRITITLNGRNRVVLGPAQYTVSKTPNPQFLLWATHKQRKNEQGLLWATHKQRVSSMGQNEKTGPSMGMSSTVQELPNNSSQTIPSESVPGLEEGFSSLPPTESVSEHIYFSSSSSSSGTCPKTDADADDDDEHKNCDFQSPSEEESEKTLATEWANRKSDPCVLAWAKKIILARARHTVKNPSAYLARALPPFLDYLADEIESALVHDVREFLYRCIVHTPTWLISITELQMFMEIDLGEVGLPWDPAQRTNWPFDGRMVRRVIEAAGLTPELKDYLDYCDLGFSVKKSWEPKHPPDHTIALRTVLYRCISEPAGWPHYPRLGCLPWGFLRRDRGLG